MNLSQWTPVHSSPELHCPRVWALPHSSSLLCFWPAPFPKAEYESSVRDKASPQCLPETSSWARNIIHLWDGTVANSAVQLAGSAGEEILLVQISAPSTLWSLWPVLCAAWRAPSRMLPAHGSGHLPACLWFPPRESWQFGGGTATSQRWSRRGGLLATLEPHTEDREPTDGDHQPQVARERGKELRTAECFNSGCIF